MWSVTFSPDGNRLASGSEDGTVILSDTLQQARSPEQLDQRAKLPRPRPEKGQPLSFYGESPDDACHVIYVIDRSDSMVTTSDFGRLQMQLAIDDLTEDQCFHIVLLGEPATLALLALGGLALLRRRRR